MFEGAVRAFVFPDRSSGDVYFATNTLVKGETDTAGGFSPTFGLSPRRRDHAPSAVFYVAALGKVYFQRQRREAPRVRRDVVEPELTEPASSAQNGRHERMHRTPKAETPPPPAGHLAAQQVRFNRFRQEYNDERPHEALGQETPGSVYEQSPRQFPRKLPAIEYPAHYETRYISANGGIRWKCAWANVTTTLAREWVALEEVGDGLWDVYFSRLRLGRLDERHMRIEDPYGRSPMSPTAHAGARGAGRR
jgi:hypothetical protein